MLFADLLSLHLVTFLMFFILVHYNVGASYTQKTHVSARLSISLDLQCLLALMQL